MAQNGRIDSATVQKILDAADIVEVVSDYVRLKRRGSGYIGLCPFHNERTPSFSVSKSRGYCKCFSCGKGGSPVGFLMEIEQISYPEALKLLAKKYNIEIEEHTLSEEEQQKYNERQSLLAVNEFALKYFERTMVETTDGQTIGHAYFRERGISDAMIKRFHLGYSLDKRDDLHSTAIYAGFNDKYLEETGLCIKNEQGQWRDRFRARVIYPIFTVSGKVVGFGGRTLRKDKDAAKYVNSPESSIYRKSFELYGLYQAKSAIVKKDKCILVEGYMDVISMHQAGVENVVASSGTSLTDGQIRLIHRFTDNVTVIYDSDPAGIKASLRGIDMLLAEGMKIKVLLLPQGDDPDSFAQNNSATVVEEYLANNEQDFISFKTHILLDGIGNDPIKRSSVITDILRSIAVIPDQIMRTVYIAECSRTFNIDEKILALQLTKLRAEKAEKDSIEQQRKANRINAGIDTPELTADSSPVPAAETTAQTKSESGFLSKYEREVLRYVMRYGMVYLGDIAVEDSDELVPFNVMQYIAGEMNDDGITFTVDIFKTTFDAMQAYASENWERDNHTNELRLAELKSTLTDEETNRIRQTAFDAEEIDRMTKDAEERIAARIDDERMEFASSFLSKAMVNHPDDNVRTLADQLVSDKHKLSKIYTKYSHVETERERLKDLVPMAYYNLKEAIIEMRIRDIVSNIGKACAETPRNDEKISALMKEHAELNEMKKELARYLGERTIAPKFR